MNKLSLLMVSMLFVMTSCVKKKDFLALQENKDLLQSTLEKTKGELDTCNDDKSGLMGKIAELEARVAKQQSDLTSKDGQITTLKGDVAAEQAKQATIYLFFIWNFCYDRSRSKAIQRSFSETIHGMPAAAKKCGFNQSING